MTENSKDSTWNEVVIVGAGMAGIAAVIKLKEAGVHDIVVLESGDDVGGTWRDNDYPGLTVDTPSLMYSFTFEQKPDWSNLFASGREVLGYVHHVVDKYDVRRHVRCNEAVVDAAWDPARAEWSTRTASGRHYRSRFLISATGVLASKANWPNIEGLDSFTGVKLHPSAWPKDLDLTGRRVAMIGTGSTGVQVAPAIADQVGQLHVFQRTPVYLLPKHQKALPPRLRRIFTRVPGVQRLVRMALVGIVHGLIMTMVNDYKRFGFLARAIERRAIKHLHSQIQDPELREKLTPHYPFGCKRPTVSSEFYPMFNKPHVELVTDSIERFTPEGIRTADGTERPLDVVICATGFQPFARGALPTYPVIGRDGTELQDYWEREHYQAFRGIAINGFPNYFMVLGPYAVHSFSYLASIERGARRIATCVTEARKRSASSIEVRAHAQREELERLREMSKSSVFFCTDCASSRTYFINRHGDNTLLRPGTILGEWLLSRRVDPDSFEFGHGATQLEAVAVNGRQGKAVNGFAATSRSAVR
jgi:cation diffusion facilitator CzcD-associated flavoprotein CzcO